jgi:hypothetical protein
MYDEDKEDYDDYDMRMKNKFKMLSLFMAKSMISTPPF